MAVISGEPGIGKTRLADELYRIVRPARACGRAQPLLRRTGASGLRARGGVAAFRCGSRRLDEPRDRSNWRNWRGLVPEIREQFPELESLGSEQPSPLAESWQRLHFYESLNAAFGKSRKPLLLYLDDMQWCDPDSFEWLNALLTSSAAAGRPRAGDGAGGRDGPRTSVHPVSARGCGNRAWLLEIPLEPLDAEETAELARLESAKPLESGNLGEIFRATRGNPLFVVESVRAGLAEHAGACRNRGAPGTAYGGFLRTGGPGERCGQALLLRIAGEGYRLGRSQRFPGARRTVAAADHRKPRERPSTISRTTACAKWPARN